MVKLLKDLERKPHSIGRGWQWRLDTRASIIQDIGFYSDGTTTFEIMVDDEVQGFLTEDQINKILVTIQLGEADAKFQFPELFI